MAAGKSGKYQVYSPQPARFRVVRQVFPEPMWANIIHN
ncbi:hypothetical protein ETAE_1257 [Edwardsiella piscicida]|uniref:Uncharacterized protein n=2 Tax=Edwardsiella TaxID=635 RepID=A0A0H3DPP0_EDWTF|nr:hypothetical protein ETAE_1257 [Edwardsiella tarda EIB202]ADM41289.1 hypothetical protein ETAF_1173 [Edwardsiella tarda FL6-60]